MDFEAAMNTYKMGSVVFTRNKGVFHLHPMEYIGTVYFLENPDFIIPHVGECISLWYNSDWKVFYVQDVWYDYKNGQIEITVK